MTATENQTELDLIAKLGDLKYTLRPGIRDHAALEKSFREKFEALVRRLPRNFLEAAQGLRKDGLAQKVLGETMLFSYLADMNDARERYHQTVTDWEVRAYRACIEKVE